MKALKAINNVFQNYVVGRLKGSSTTASYWYLPEPPNMFDSASLAAWRAQKPNPPYLMNYKSKLAYQQFHANGLIILDYGEPLGPRINPEASSQWLLGLHQRALETKSEQDTAEFIRLAEELRKLQMPNGTFPYDFPWSKAVPPWGSALAQGRGLSVMLRAHALTGGQKYLDSAHLSFSLFDVPLADGGYQHVFEPENCVYFEEYPLEPRGTLNGFMSILLGLWEMGELTGDARAKSLFAIGLSSLEKMLPHYTTDWWTLYDLSPDDNFKNYHSPRYHTLVIDYLRVLNTLAPTTVLQAHLDKWQRWNTPTRRFRALMAKLLIKVKYR